MATNKTDDQNFKADVLDSKEPVLVDFGPNGVVHVRQSVHLSKNYLMKCQIN